MWAPNYRFILHVEASGPHVAFSTHSAQTRRLAYPPRGMRCPQPCLLPTIPPILIISISTLLPPMPLGNLRSPASTLNLFAFLLGIIKCYYKSKAHTGSTVRSPIFTDCPIVLKELSFSPRPNHTTLLASSRLPHYAQDATHLSLPQQR